MLISLSEDNPMTLCPVTGAIVLSDQVGDLLDMKPPNFSHEIQGNQFYESNFTIEGKDGFQTVFNKFVK